ncbi:MAG: hypothetical protein MCM46_18105 [Candidatus Manganitrophus sp. SB1]|nr:hypothetical protein [Candidatus Manganitrophus morganii]
MNTELVVALISGGIALVSAGFAMWGQFTSARLAADLQNLQLAEARRLEREKTVSRYREPLARAAHDLQSRLYNILAQGFIGLYAENRTERERSYVLNNTVYLIAQYFAWTEIIRRDIQHIDLGTEEETTKLARLQDNTYRLWQTDRFGSLFRVFAGEQRAIGERMIIETPRGPECIGYSAFLDQNLSEKEPLLNALREDVRGCSASLEEARPRLIAIQNVLIDLLDFLDPNYVRFPKERRRKVGQ